MELSWAIIIFLVSQTLAAVWWASKITSDVHYIKNSVSDIKHDVNEKYPNRDGTHLESRLGRLEEHLVFIGRSK